MGGLPRSARSCWRLESGEARAAAAPETFEIPERDHRERIPVGWFAKLIFRIEAVDEICFERMWVEVRARSGNRYLGTLANHPACQPAGDFALGTPVAFGPEHVIDLYRPD